jgi:hypothetical protein
VTPADIFPYLTGPVAAVVVLIWVVWMQRQDIREMRREREALLRRADSAEDAARTANALISGLLKQAVGGGGDP